jgi:peptide/nickel transport system permease protein
MENNPRTVNNQPAAGTAPRGALWVLGILLLLALGRDLLCNDRPLYCTVNGQSFFPAFHTLWYGKSAAYTDPELNRINRDNQWATYPYGSVLFAPIAFAPGAISTFEAQPPLSVHPESGFRHWMGTDAQGRDVAAGVIAGARVAFWAGLLAAGIALLLGGLLGGLAGFFGDDRLRWQRGVFWGTSLGAVTGFVYLFLVRGPALKFMPDTWLPSVLISAGLVFLGYFLGKILSFMPFFKQKMTVPADFLIMRTAEIFRSIPVLVLLLAVVTLSPALRSVWVILGLIGLFSWPGVAQFIRAELLKIREMDYIAAARVMGFPESRILLRHALPNAYRPAMVVFSLSVSSAILTEAALSFLNLSDPALTGASWGSLLNSAQSNFGHWWVVLAPALAISATVISLYRLTESFRGGSR